MRGVSILACMIALAAGACAETLQPTTSRPYISTPPSGTAARGLPAQDLPPGNCGVFLFTRDARPRFVLFDHLDAGLVRVWIDGEMRHVTVDPRREPPGEGQTYRRQISTDGEMLFFAGEIELPVGGEAAIPRAVMRRVLPGGSEAVIPLTGVFLCQPPSN